MELNIDNSRLEPIAKCTTMAILKSVHGYRGKAEKFAADVGTCGHEAMLSWFFTKPGDAWEALSQFNDMYDTLIGENAVEERLRKSNIRSILSTWFEKHSLDRFPFDVMSGEECVGYKLEKGVWFWGKIDMVVKDKLTGFVSPLDHKTTGRVLGDWWMRDFRLKSQFSGYKSALELEYGAGKVTDYIYVNAVRFNKLPENMGWKCRTHKVKYQECWTEHVEYLLFKVFRSRDKMNGWKRDAKWFANRLGLLIQAYPDVTLAKIAPKEGTFNGSCTFCEFNKFCQMDCVDTQIDELLVKDAWEPWEGERVRRIG